MSIEEVKKEEVKEETIKEIVPEVVLSTELEQRAISMGWKPKEEFSGEEDDFIDAKEFVRRQPLFDKIESQNKQVKLLNRSINELKEHYTKVNQAAYDRALIDLKNQRKEAIANGDGDAFTRIDDQIKDAETQKAELEVLNKPIPQQEIPEFASWRGRNSWYNSVTYMRAFADEIGVKLHQRGLAPEEVLVEVEKAVRKEFPEKFRNPNKENAIQLENGKNVSGKAKETYQLTDMERKIMNDFARTKVMTPEQYIQSLKDMQKGRA